MQENHISGSIRDLTLPSLVQFNVSNNNLTGEIPKGFFGKSKSSFLSNALCGSPLDNSCGSENHKKKLSDGAIDGIVIGAALGLFLILLLIFCLCRKLGRKGAGSKDLTGVEGHRVGVPREKAVEGESTVHLRIISWLQWGRRRRTGAKRMWLVVGKRDWCLSVKWI